MIPQNFNEWGCAIGLAVITIGLFLAMYGTLMCDKSGPEDLYEE